MTAEVVATVHQLAKDCKYKGIIFTNTDGNIINDNNDSECENIEITGVTEQEYINNNDKYIEDTTGAEQVDMITGVKLETHTNGNGNY